MRRQIRPRDAFLFLTLALSLFLASLFSACAPKLDPAFDRSKLLDKAGQTLVLLNRGDYEGVRQMGTDSFRQQFGEEAQRRWQFDIRERAGNLETIDGMVTDNAGKDAAGAPLALVQAKTWHQNRLITYAFVFDAEYRLVSLEAK